MPTKNLTWWTHVVFDDFCLHFISLSKEERLNDIEESIKALLAKDPSGNSFGAKMVASAIERIETNRSKKGIHGSLGGRPRKNSNASGKQSFPEALSGKGHPETFTEAIDEPAESGHYHAALGNDYTSTVVTTKAQSVTPQRSAQTESPMVGRPGAQLESASGAVSGKFFGCRKNVWLTDDDAQTLIDTFSDLPKKKFTEAANTLSLKFARLASAHKPIPQDHCAELSKILQAMNIKAAEEKRLERKEKMVDAVQNHEDPVTKQRRELSEFQEKLRTGKIKISIGGNK